ncbi:MAG: SLC13 family permease [Gammaproteobacteria bacterium]|nr:SLC13 family permease [Gammaproteobacteria bacterium]
MKNITRKVTFSLTSLIFVGFLIQFIRHSNSLSTDIALAATLLTITLLISGLVMEYLAFLIFMAIVIICKLAPAAVTFSGFTSPAFWLIFAGLPIGLAIQKTGLANRIAYSLIKICKGHYSILVMGMAAFGMLMAFIMPSSAGRVILILPIIIAFAKANGFDTESRGHTGLLLSGIFASNIAGFTILPSNLPNIILMGSMSSLYHLNLTYTGYLLLHFPILGLLKVILMVVIVTFMFNDRPSLLKLENFINLEKVSSAEKRLTLYLVLVLIAWLSDSYTNLSPAWPALAIAVVCLLPKIGILDHRNFMKEINTEILFYVAGLVGLSAVINYTGIGSIIGQELIAHIPFAAGHNFFNYYLLTFCSMIIGLLTTLPGIPAIMAPLSGQLAQATHLPLTTVLITQVIGYSMFILPYQSPPLLIAMRLSNLSFKHVIKLCLIMTALSIIVIMPLDYLWLMLNNAI